MQLKKIKIAGFKSFVDPTTVVFEKQMTAIVGPNGCGKSNVIDAVRWVLGESSAKNLRGETMADVIFNGSTERKPIGQASVELFFENSSQQELKESSSSTDPFNLKSSSISRYHEVSIKRLVNRDGINQYFINGTKCRRKDVTDIFLGTGLGPRSYAIIEQGTIAKLIESKPKELRVFIEEAAGISKYKERRKETEAHIVRTQENMARLNDIANEISLQLSTLQAQSTAAVKYKQLKSNERLLTAELQAFKYQHQLSKQNEASVLIAQCQTQLGEQNQQLNTIQQHIKLFQENLNELQKTRELQQQQELVLTKEITQAEQQLHFELKRESELNKRQIELDRQIKQYKNEQASLVLKRDELAQDIAKIESKINLSKEKLQTTEQLHIEKQQSLDSLDNKMSLQREKYQRFIEKQAQLKTQQSIFLAKVEQHKNRIKEELAKKSVLNQQISALQLNDSNEQQSINVLEQQIQQYTEALALHQPVIIELEQQKSEQQQLIQQLESTISTSQHEKTFHQKQLKQLVQNNKTQSSWQQTQQTFLLNHEIEAVDITQFIEVKQGWETAIETVLGPFISADFISSHSLNQSEFLQQLSNLLPFWSLVFSTTSKEHLGEERLSDNESLLASKVTYLQTPPMFITQLLNNVVIADTITEGLSLLPQLMENQSIICADGTWFNEEFACKLPAKNDAPLTVESKRQQFISLIEQLTVTVEKQSLQLSQGQSLLFSIQQQLEQATEKCKQIEYDLVNSKQHVLLKKQATEQKLNELNERCKDCEQLIVKLEESLIIEQSQLNDVSLQLTMLTETNDQNLNHESELERQSINQQLKEIATNRQQQQQSLHQQTLTLTELKYNHSQTEQALERSQQYLEQSNKQQHELVLSLQQLHNVSAKKQKIESTRNDLVSLQQNKQLTEQQLADYSAKIQENEHQQKSIQQSLLQLQQRLNEQQLLFEKSQLIIDSCQQYFQQSNYLFDEIIKKIPSSFNESQQQAAILSVSKDIKRLGEINLGAISEFERAKGRFDYINDQMKDLADAIDILNKTMSKIENESREKFSITFDAINNGLKTLFPKIFSGGHAYLTLTNDELLEAGVTIMAQPPGKKNSSIALLSGGEKALVALSLVFAIFQLNPAPFCMLDEVDAPLDDINVGRFCKLVTEMSQSVQFIFISHNKIAMEMATQLTGVTMVEPGVSHMVSVDIDEAIAMAEIS